MTWQDWVIGIGQFVFFIALIPTIKGKNKPAVSTAITTAITMSVYIPTLWTLKLYWSVLPTVLGTVAWWIITYQSWKKRSD
jgi:hypothetical protein